MAISIPLKTVFDDRDLKSAQKKIGDFGSKLAVGITAAFAAGAYAAVSFGKDAIQAAEAVQVADNRVKNIAESMGLYGGAAEQVSQRIIALAESQEGLLGVDAELIKAGQAQLLTFKEVASSADVAGGAFDRATFAAIDLAAAGFGSIDSASIMLGKALQDPVKGLTALGRAGVTFTEEEKKLIKTLVESGDQFKAQEMILKAVETQVGGTAAATGTASDKIALAFENISEEVGAALLPVLDDLLPILTELAVELGENLAQAVKEIDFKAIVEDIGNFTTFVIENYDSIVNWGKGLAAAAAAFVALKVAIDLAKIASILFAATPIGAVIAAIGLLVGITLIATGATGDFSDGLTDAEREAKSNADELARLTERQQFYTEAIENGYGPIDSYEEKLADVNDEIARLEELQKTATDTVVVATQKYSNMNLTLDNAKTKLDFMKNATRDAEREVRLFTEQIYISNAGLDHNALTLENAKTKVEFFKDGTAKATREMERFIEYAYRMRDAANVINDIRVPSVGGITNPGQSPIPLAEGGIVMPRPGGTLAQIGEAGQAEAVIPLDRLGKMGGNNYSITINAGVGADPVAIGRYVSDAIKKFERVSGKVFANA